MRNTLKQILILLDYCIAKYIVTCKGNIGYKILSVWAFCWTIFLERRRRDWKIKLFVLKIEADIQDFEFEVHSEYEQKKRLRPLSMLLSRFQIFEMLSSCWDSAKKYEEHVERALKNIKQVLSMR